MTETTVSLDYPILFVADPNHASPVVAELELGSWWAGNATGVSVRVCSYVDGDVTVRLALDSTAARQDGLLCHLQEVETPSKRLAVLSADNQELLSVEVPDETTRVCICVNSAEHADDLSVSILR